MSTYTNIDTQLLPEFLDRQCTQPFNPKDSVIFTSGLIASGKNQLVQMIANELFTCYGLDSIEFDPDKEFPSEYNPKMDDPTVFHEHNRAAAQSKFLHHLRYPDGRIPIWQSGGATRLGPYGRVELMLEAIRHGKKPIHFLVDTPVDICRSRNEWRKSAGRRYTPSKEFERCVQYVVPNFKRLGQELRGDGTLFPEGEVYNTSVIFRYISGEKYEVIRPDVPSFFVRYHWDRKTNSPFLTEWMD